MAWYIQKRVEEVSLERAMGFRYIEYNSRRRFVKSENVMCVNGIIKRVVKKR